MYGAISANKRNTVFIMAVFVGIITGVGYVISKIYAQPSLTLWVLIGSGLYALIQYFAASKLAVAMTGAHEIEKRDNPRLYRIVENLAITTGMPTPKVYVIDDPAPNAFATGRDPKHAIVAATTGILEIMTDRELTAVMAHEIGHVRNYDIRVSMIAVGLVSAVAMLSDIAMRMLFYGDNDNRNVQPIFYVIGLIAVILAPIAASLVQLAISRQREYLADASGALTTRDPEALVGALEKLGQYGRPMQKQNTATAHLFFNNPLRPGFFAKLFSTHPPLEERIARLQENATKF